VWVSTLSISTSVGDCWCRVFLRTCACIDQADTTNNNNDTNTNTTTTITSRPSPWPNQRAIAEATTNTTTKNNNGNTTTTNRNDNITTNTNTNNTPSPWLNKRNCIHYIKQHHPSIYLAILPFIHPSNHTSFLSMNR
jgi:hypothetical protein